MVAPGEGCNIRPSRVSGNLGLHWLAGEKKRREETSSLCVASGCIHAFPNRAALFLQSRALSCHVIPVYEFKLHTATTRGMAVGVTSLPPAVGERGPEHATWGK